MVRAFNVKFGREVPLQGEVLLPDATYPVPGAILCHGLGSGRGSVRSSGLILAKHGIAALVFDFRGHGRSGGIFDGNEVEDVVNAWHWLSQFDGVDRDRIGLIGHSMGARAAILAAGEIDFPRAVVSLACPPDWDEKLSQDASVDLEQWLREKTAVMEYPRDGALPWVKGIRAIIGRLWMYLRGYRLRIDWQRVFKRLSNVKISAVLPDLQGSSKLFVHSQGDKLIPYQVTVEFYQKTPEPKDLLVAKGGDHSTPLMPGSLRRRWISWVVNVLTAGRGE